MHVARRTPAQSPPQVNSPIEFIFWALRIIPRQTKFVLSGLVVLAAASLVLSWARQFSLWTTIGVAVIIIVFGLVVATLSAFINAERSGLLGGFLAWALALLFVAVLILLVTSAFF